MQPQSFADEWVESWNSHDLDRILSHYDSEIVFLSPIALQTVGIGRIVGMAALRDYWSRSLAARPDLKFELVEVLAGHQCLTIRYRNHRGQSAAETFEFSPDGKVVRSFACYA